MFQQGLGQHVLFGPFKVQGGARVPIPELTPGALVPWGIDIGTIVE